MVHGTREGVEQRAEGGPIAGSELRASR